MTQDPWRHVTRDDQVAATAGQESHEDPWRFVGDDANAPADTGVPPVDNSTEPVDNPVDNSGSLQVNEEASQ